MASGECLEDIITHYAKTHPTRLAEHVSIPNSSFTMLHLNARSLNNKMDQLEFLLAKCETKFSCIAISETWLNNFTYSPQFYLHGYNFFAVPGATNQAVASLFTF